MNNENPAATEPTRLPVRASDLAKDYADLAAGRMLLLASDLAANRGTEQDERAVAESRNEAIGSLSRLAPMVPADVAAGIYGQIDAIARGWVTVPALFPDTLRRWALAWRAFADRS
jgi:hypothetical protein